MKCALIITKCFYHLRSAAAVDKSACDHLASESYLQHFCRRCWWLVCREALFIASRREEGLIMVSMAGFHVLYNPQCSPFNVQCAVLGVWGVSCNIGVAAPS